MPNVLMVIGTRPEAIKMAPVYRALSGGGIDVDVILSGQHVELLEDVLGDLHLPIHRNLGAMRPGQSIDELLTWMIDAFSRLLDLERPALVLVHGDTLTSLGAATAAFLRRFPVAHVEAGLRSGSLSAPWPEEGARRMIDGISTLHFAPTQGAMKHLAAEGYGASSILTGNTVVDAVVEISNIVQRSSSWRQDARETFGLSHLRPLILATLHRREGLDSGLKSALHGLRRLAESGIQVALPVHKNPEVALQIRDALSNTPNILMLPSLSYSDFVQLQMLSDLIVTDSGGVQEEAPVLGKYCLVVRETTERPEGIDAGVAELVGYSGEHLFERAVSLLDGSRPSLSDRQRFLYGDGSAGLRTSAAITAWLQTPAPSFG